MTTMNQTLMIAGRQEIHPVTVANTYYERSINKTFADVTCLKATVRLSFSGYLADASIIALACSWIETKIANGEGLWDVVA